MIFSNPGWPRLATISVVRALWVAQTCTTRAFSVIRPWLNDRG